jgi:hypothetical protein
MQLLRQHQLANTQLCRIERLCCCMLSLDAQDLYAALPEALRSGAPGCSFVLLEKELCWSRVSPTHLT